MTIEIGNGPMPHIPLKKECWHSGCTNLLEWQVGITVYGVLDGVKYPCHSETSVTVCTEHRKDITVAHMVTDEGWVMICAGFRLARRLEPTRELTELRFLPILNLPGATA